MSWATYVCHNPDCGERLSDAESATLWMRSEFGYTTIRSCRTQECARAAVEDAKQSRGWRLCKDNLPPMDRETCEAFLAEREKEETT